MTQHFTDFSEYSTGSLNSAADWDLAWDNRDVFTVTTDAGAEGGKYIDTVPSTAGFNAIMWTEPGSVSGNAEALVKVRLPFTFSYRVGVILCGTNGTGNSNVDGYYACLLTGGLFLRRVNNRSDSYLADTSFSVSAGSWYWLRFQKSGTTIRARAWLDGNSEPGTWGVSITDSTFSAGHIGLIAYESQPQDFDVLGVGTGTDTAPSEEPVTSTDVTVTGVVAEATAAAPVPTVTASTNTTVAGVVGEASADAPQPVVTAAQAAQVDAVVAEATAAALVPEIATTTNASIAGEVGEATAAAVAPAVSTTSSASIDAVVGEATAAAPSPVVVTGTSAVIAGEVGSASADAPAPTVTAGRSNEITAVVGEATASAPAPVVSTVASNTRPDAVVAEATADAPAPTVTVTTTESVSIGAPVASATADAPTSTISAQRLVAIVSPVAEATADARPAAVETFSPRYDLAITVLRGSLEEELVLHPQTGTVLLGTFTHEVVLDRSGFATSEA